MKLSEQVAELEETAADKAGWVETLKKEKHELQKGFDARGREVERLQKKVKEFEDSPLKAQVDDLEQQIKELGESKVKLQNRNLQKKNSELESQLQKERNANAGSKLQAKIDTLQRETDRIKTEAQASAKSYLGVQKEAREAREEVGELRAKLERAAKDLASSEETREGQRGLIEELKAANVTAKKPRRSNEDDPEPEPKAEGVHVLPRRKKKKSKKVADA